MRSYKRRRPPVYKNPYQYVLRFPALPREIPVAPPPKPHLLYLDGRWHLFRNRWKSRFHGPVWAANLSATSIPVLSSKLARRWDRVSFGWYRAHPELL